MKFEVMEVFTHVKTVNKQEVKMKYYKEFFKEYIGSSDIAKLTLVDEKKGTTVIFWRGWRV